jgi:hypothetical protein
LIVKSGRESKLTQPEIYFSFLPLAIFHSSLPELQFGVPPSGGSLDKDRLKAELQTPFQFLSFEIHSVS